MKYGSVKVRCGDKGNDNNVMLKTKIERSNTERYIEFHTLGNTIENNLQSPLYTVARIGAHLRGGKWVWFITADIYSYHSGVRVGYFEAETLSPDPKFAELTQIGEHEQEFLAKAYQLIEQSKTNRTWVRFYSASTWDAMLHDIPVGSFRLFVKFPPQRKFKLRREYRGDFQFVETKRGDVQAIIPSYKQIERIFHPVAELNAGLSGDWSWAEQIMAGVYDCLSIGNAHLRGDYVVYEVVRAEEKVGDLVFKNGAPVLWKDVYGNSKLIKGISSSNTISLIRGDGFSLIIHDESLASYKSEGWIYKRNVIRENPWGDELLFQQAKTPWEREFYLASSKSPLLRLVFKEDNYNFFNVLGRSDDYAKFNVDGLKEIDVTYSPSLRSQLLRVEKDYLVFDAPGVVNIKFHMPNISNRDGKVRASTKESLNKWVTSIRIPGEAGPVVINIFHQKENQEEVASMLQDVGIYMNEPEVEL